MAFLKNEKSNQANKNAHIITIERPLEPQPPKDAKHEWCYFNRLIFYDKNQNSVWNNEIKEATILDEKGNQILHPEPIYVEGFGWKLKSTISDENAKFLHPIILSKLAGQYET